MSETLLLFIRAWDRLCKVQKMTQAELKFLARPNFFFFLGFGFFGFFGIFSFVVSNVGSLHYYTILNYLVVKT